MDRALAMDKRGRIQESKGQRIKCPYCGRWRTYKVYWTDEYGKFVHCLHCTEKIREDWELSLSNSELKRGEFWLYFALAIILAVLLYLVLGL